MKSFARMILGIFALCITLFAFAYLFSPHVRTAMSNSSSTVGQLKDDQHLVSPGQVDRGAGSESGTTSSDAAAPTTAK